jgi:hypothetical protein
MVDTVRQNPESRAGRKLMVHPTDSYPQARFSLPIRLRLKEPSQSPGYQTVWFREACSIAE